MKGFSIRLSDNMFDSEGDSVSSGSIKIGNFEEAFQASLSYWDRSRYLSQWKEALNRLLSGERSSAIITTMYDPNTANFIFWWVMYLIGDDVHIQNHVLFLDELERSFDENDLYSFIPERETQNEEGESVSEWVVGLSSIEECVGSM
jgi:hypothetical protein